LKAPELFGDFTALGGKRWEDLYAYSLEGIAEIIVIDYEKVHSLYLWVSETKEKSDFSEFLASSIPGFASWLMSSKEKISKLFTEKRFVAGTVIANEGTVQKEAFIIKSGQCKIVSSGIPKLFEEEDDDQDIKVVWEHLSNNKGYFS